MYQHHNGSSKQLLRPLTAGNIAAIEPYHHVPSLPGDLDDHSKPIIRQPVRPDKPERRSQYLEPVGAEQIYNHERLAGPQDDSTTKSIGGLKNPPPTQHQNSSPVDDNYKVSKEDRSEAGEGLAEFGASKSDPKYQTLPYNTKFTVNYVTHPGSGGAMMQRRPPGEGGENIVCESVETVKNNNNSANHINNNMSQQQLMSVVHSIPIPTGVSKGLATPLANQNKLSPSVMSSSSSTSSTSSMSVLPPR